MGQPAIGNGKSAARRCLYRLLGLALVLLSLALALPAGASAFVSTGDGGWHAQDASVAGNPSDLKGVFFLDAQYGWALGGFGEASSTGRPIILATVDGGATWAAEDVGIASGTNAFLRSVVFVDAKHGWAVGDDDNGALVLATTDGGTTWSAQDASNAGSSYAFLNSVTFVDLDHGWAVGRTYDEGTDTWPPLILATSDGGATWDAQDPGSISTLDGTAELNAVTFVSAQRGWAVGSTGAAYDESRIILATSDGGATWSAQNAQAPDNGEGLYSVSFIDAERGWAVGGLGLATNGSGYPAIITTRNGGVTWSAQDASSAVKVGFLGSVTFVDANNGWAVGRSTRFVDSFPGFAFSSLILATADGGASWHKQRTNDAEELAGLEFIDATHGWVVGGTFNGATDTWAPLILATTTGGFPASGSTPTLTLRLSGLKHGVLRLGKRVTARGVVTPTSLAGSKVTLTAQLKKGSKWVKAKTFSALISSTGAYSWKYKPAKKGAYRMRSSIAKSAAHPVAMTKWLTFKVK